MTISELKAKLNTSIEHFKTQLTSIRTGRATTSLVEEIPVEAYSSTMTVREVGTISTPDSQMILISPWDKGLLKAVEAAIRDSNLGLNPVVDSSTVKVPIPALTEERRKEFTKLVTERLEEAKNTIRGHRHEMMREIDRQFEAKEITEDDKFAAKEEVEAVVKQSVELADGIAESKKKDLMTL